MYKANNWHTLCTIVDRPIIDNNSMKPCQLPVQNCQRSCGVAAQSGYTLIELMTAVAIIGILAATATVSYQTQVRKTQIMTIYKEINHFRLPYRTLIDNGAGVTDFSPRGLNMPAQTKYCQFSVTAPLAGSTTANAIICRIHNLPYLQAQMLSLDYLTDGTWQCQASAGIKDAYLPQACQ
ncbi:pilin [Psychrobacter celer]|uniref:pilin n=1 Tax=Psychrobacter celer TaxID=306572 RepID=UPI002FE46FEF